MDIHTLQFCDRLFHGYQNHDKKRNRLEIKQKRHKDGLEVLCERSRVSSGPEPVYKPNPLNHKQLRFAHLAKLVQTHFVEDSDSQQFLPLTIECIPIIIHMALANTRLYLCRGKSFKNGVFFETEAHCLTK